MIVRRLATVVVAAALIVGAFLIRRNVIEGDDDADAGNAPEPASQLVCLTELEDVCTELLATHPDLDLTVEDARTTLDRVAAGDPVPLWLTFEPFPAMADPAPFAADRPPLASSRLSVVTPTNRRDTLVAHCGTTALWRCIGDVAGAEWSELDQSAAPGRVEPSVGDAGESALALASFAVAVAGYFGTVQLNSGLWLNDAAFIPWVRGLVREVPLSDLTSGTPAATLLTRPSAVNVAATSDAEIASLGAPAAELEPSYPEPSMWLQAVLATPAGTDVPDGLARDAAAALTAAGWARPETAAQPLPSATTMLALRQLWEEIQ